MIAAEKRFPKAFLLRNKSCISHSVKALRKTSNALWHCLSWQYHPLLCSRNRLPIAFTRRITESQRQKTLPSTLHCSSSSVYSITRKVLATVLKAGKILPKQTRKPTLSLLCVSVFGIPSVLQKEGGIWFEKICVELELTRTTNS